MANNGAIFYDLNPFCIGCKCKERYGTSKMIGLLQYLKKCNKMRQFATAEKRIHLRKKDAFAESHNGLIYRM